MAHSPPTPVGRCAPVRRPSAPVADQEGKELTTRIGALRAGGGTYSTILSPLLDIIVAMISHLKTRTPDGRSLHAAFRAVPDAATGRTVLRARLFDQSPESVEVSCPLDPDSLGPIWAQDGHAMSRSDVTVTPAPRTLHEAAVALIALASADLADAKRYYHRHGRARPQHLPGLWARRLSIHPWYVHPLSGYAVSRSHRRP